MTQGKQRHKTLEVICSTQPLSSYLELLKHFCESYRALFDFSDLGFEFARLEVDRHSASTLEIFVIFYPSDSLFRFIGATITGDRGGYFVQ